MKENYHKICFRYDCAKCQWEKMVQDMHRAARKMQREFEESTLRKETKN